MLSEFERRAWDNRGRSDNHKPEMACKVVIDDIERETLKNVEHIIVVVVEKTDDGGSLIGTYNAGTLSELAVEGALGRAIRMAVDNRRGTQA
jgi:bisphosphoglycerate-independent phosphoglycerate mutase (AlkP superfamily)